MSGTSQGRRKVRWWKTPQVRYGERLWKCERCKLKCLSTILCSECSLMLCPSCKPDCDVTKACTQCSQGATMIHTKKQEALYAVDKLGESTTATLGDARALRDALNEIIVRTTEHFKKACDEVLEAEKMYETRGHL